jgi:DNA-binding protein H-NS
MLKSSLDALSNQALCKLRDEIAEVLKGRAESLQREINQLIGPTSFANIEHQREPRKRRKVAPKYRGPHGEKWSGRGKKPRWLTIAMSEGKQLEDFVIDTPKKNSPQAPPMQEQHIDP